MWQEAMTLLRVWCTVGADTPNGYWSILGARAGLSLMMDYPSTEYQKIADYDWFVAKFHEYVGKVGGKVDDLHEYIVYDDALMIQTIESLGHYIKERSNLEFCMFDPAQSRMVKTLLKPPVYNLDPMVEG
jgi:hypothetical protein